MKKTNMIKRVISAAVSSTVILSSVVFAAEFKDMPDNWATGALNAAVANGLISGDNGYIMPDNYMTRAQMAAIMVRATGAKKEADISSFTDVPKSEWYYSPMAKAVYMEAFTGADNKLNPESFITRQEAFVVLSRVFGLIYTKEKDTSSLDAFSDKDEIADWAKEAVALIVKAGYVGGNDGKINPNSNITRAEFAVVMDRLVKYYIDEPGDYTPASDGNIMIRSKDVNINKLTTDKMICIGDLDAEDKVNFNECNISGTVAQRGGYLTLDGTYTDLRAYMEAATLDITKLEKPVLKNMKSYIRKATYFIDYSKYVD